MKNDKGLCGFCDKNKEFYPIKGANVSICHECLTFANEIINNEMQQN